MIPSCFVRGGTGGLDLNCHASLFRSKVIVAFHESGDGGGFPPAGFSAYVDKVSDDSKIR
jgi:hypothetical protein